MRSFPLPGIDDDQLVKDVEEKLPSLPIAYWTKHKAIQAQANSKNTKQCAKYPSIFDLHFNNIYWQTLQTSNGTFQLFGGSPNSSKKKLWSYFDNFFSLAYFDNRKNSKIGPSVSTLVFSKVSEITNLFQQLRILGMIDRLNPTVKTFCQLWFDGQKEPFIVKTFEYK